MLIKFSEIVNKYGIPKGIIHIGAHLMEERNDYLGFGIKNLMWIEANPKIYNSIKYVNSDIERVFNFAVSDKNDDVCIFKITNNGQSSSLLELDLHKLYHPHVYVVEEIEVKTKRMDNLLYENNIDIKDSSMRI